jgi:excisionase family DNA binding protein
VPATRPPRVRRQDLPDIATVAEYADYLRLDGRTVRKACECGDIPGAERIGRSWRIDTAVARPPMPSCECERHHVPHD